MLFRKVKDKRAKRALENGNEEAPLRYQQIGNDKHVHGVHSGWKGWNSWKSWEMGLFSKCGWKSCKNIWFSPTLAGKAGI